MSIQDASVLLADLRLATAWSQAAAASNSPQRVFREHSALPHEQVYLSHRRQVRIAELGLGTAPSGASTVGHKTEGVPWSLKLPDSSTATHTPSCLLQLSSRLGGTQPAARSVDSALFDLTARLALGRALASSHEPEARASSSVSDIESLHVAGEASDVAATSDRTPSDSASIRSADTGESSVVGAGPSVTGDSLKDIAESLATPIGEPSSMSAPCSSRCLMLESTAWQTLFLLQACGEVMIAGLPAEVADKQAAASAVDVADRGEGSEGEAPQAIESLVTSASVPARSSRVRWDRAILVIGGGAAAQCTVRCGLQTGILVPEAVTVATPDGGRDQGLMGLCSCGIVTHRCARTVGGARAAVSRGEACVKAARSARIVILACPCEAVAVVGVWLLPLLQPGSVIISLLAGVTSKDVAALLTSETDAVCKALVLPASTHPLPQTTERAANPALSARMTVESALIEAAGLGAALRRDEAVAAAQDLLPNPDRLMSESVASVASSSVLSAASRIEDGRSAEAALRLLSQLRQPSISACKAACSELLRVHQGGLSAAMLLATACLANRAVDLERHLQRFAAALGIADFLWEALSSTRVFGLGIAGSSTGMLAKTIHSTSFLDAVALPHEMDAVRAGIKPVVATVWDSVRQAGFAHDTEPADPRLALPVVPTIRITRDGRVFARPKLQTRRGKSGGAIV